MLIEARQSEQEAYALLKKFEVRYEPVLERMNSELNNGKIIEIAVDPSTRSAGCG